MCSPATSHLLEAPITLAEGICSHLQYSVITSIMEPHEMFKAFLSSHLTPSLPAPSQASVSPFALEDTSVAGSPSAKIYSNTPMEKQDYWHLWEGNSTLFGNRTPGAQLESEVKKRHKEM